MRNFNESDYLEDLYYGPEKGYFDEISEIENGGYDEDFETEEFKNPHLAAEIHQAAQRAGLSDLDYVNQQEFFDKIIDSDPKDGPYIVDIEESDGYSEFICDDNGNPNLEDARPIYDNLVSGREKGLYGSDCKDDPARALEDVIEGYDMMVSDAMLGSSTLKGALNLLVKYKDNPNCPKTRTYFNALANYAEQINTIATEIGLNEFCIDIPGNLALKKEAISFKRPMKESWDENTIANAAQAYVDGYPEGVTRTNVVADLENDPYFYNKYDTIMSMDVEDQETALADYADELDNIADAIIEEIKGMGGVMNESRKITRRAILEARRKNKKEHKAYKMKEEEEAEWSWDLKTEKKALRKSMPTATDNEITIKAADNIAKKYHTTRAKILATLKPSNNIKGAKTWNKDGKILVKESRLLRESEEMLSDYQKELIREMFRADVASGVAQNPYDSSVTPSFREVLEEDGDFEGVVDAAIEYYAELVIEEYGEPPFGMADIDAYYEYESGDDQEMPEHDMGEMYGVPYGASSEAALKFFEDESEEDECEGKDCKKKSKKDKLNEISEESLAKLVVAYKADDPDKKPLKDSQGEVYAIPYNEDLSDKQNIDKLKRFLRQKDISESAILKLKFKKMAA